MEPHPYSYRSQTSYLSYATGRIDNGKWINLKAYFIDKDKKAIVSFGYEDMQIYQRNDDDLWCVDNLLETANWIKNT